MIFIKMQLCDRMQKLWLLVCFIAITSLYIITIHFQLSFSEWGPTRFLLGDSSTGLPRGINNTTKLILFWNSMFGDKTFYFGRGNIFKNCPGIPKGSCYATHDRYATKIENFNAIVFHGNELNTGELPENREPHQKYVFVNLESPASRSFPHVLFENYFNLTMTYRLDSDIPWTYGALRDKQTGFVSWPLYRAPLWKTPVDATDNVKKLRLRSRSNVDWKTKTKTAAWFVSNCKSKSGREKYVDELSKYIQIDVYGRCGTESCAKDEDCFQTVVEPNYFFYLSFENSLCQDYVTEKLYNALMYDVVPVVYGGVNYSRFAPPNSYINALDFASPRDLAKYLKKLTDQPDEYAKYFKWKNQYEVASSNNLAICRLCQILHDEEFKPKTYDPLSMWYYNDKCPLQDKLKNQPYITKKDL